MRPRRLGFALAAALVAALTAPAPAQVQQVPATRCADCHGREHRRLAGGSHQQILQTDLLPGCETCHGPGLAHTVAADNDPLLIRLPSALDGAAQSALCGKCHGDQIARHGGDPQGFRVAGRVCTDCHSVHDRERDPLEPGLRFLARATANAGAEPIGSRKCVECHPLRDALLAESPHAELAAAHDEQGCEACHGNGSLHWQSDGEGRLISRPDRATDGIATCRSCHQEVDATEFHWAGRTAPYLSAGATCTTCHVVHAARPAAAAAVAAATAPATTNRLCATCHAAAFATMPGSTHRPLGGLDQPLATGCGSCHVGGEEHARGGGRKELLAPWRDRADAQAEICLQCHRDSRTLEHVRYGDHLRRGVTCTDCHGPLHGAQHGHTADDAEKRCGECHPAVAAEFRLPNHHPVPEGRIRCSSCHDVHGAGRRRTIYDLQLTERACVGCHRSYAGPFPFPHQAGRRQGCVVCHTPHGATNRRMLHQVNTQQNCLQCHGDFPAFHDQTPGAVFTNCIRCHTEVHGSNHSRYLFR